MAFSLLTPWLAQDVENRKRIQDLLALTRPVAQEVTYFRDEKPKTLSRSLAAPAAKSKPRTAPGTNAAPNVIRTIYMPNSKTVEQLQAAVESLRTRLMQTVMSGTSTLGVGNMTGLPRRNWRRSGKRRTARTEGFGFRKPRSPVPKIRR